MKIKFLFISLFTIALLATGTTSCETAEPTEKEPTKIDETTIFTTKYTKEKVWDAQRSPAYPTADQDWTLSGLKNALDLERIAIDWGTGRYVMFIAETDNTNSIYSITDDLYNTGTKYSIALKLYESNGTLVRVLSTWGQIIGIGDKGFMYVAEGKIGMFFPVSGAKVGDTVTYRPTTLTVTKLSQLYK